MKQQSKMEELPLVEELAALYVKQFSSQEEAERYNKIQDLERTDMEKFRLFCKMLRIGKMLASAKIVK